MTNEDREVELTGRLAMLEARLAELEARAHDAEARAQDAEARAQDAGSRGGREAESVETLMAGFLPPDVRSHLRAARKEQLLAARSMIDHWLARVDRRPPERRRRESIPVEDA